MGLFAHWFYGNRIRKIYGSDYMPPSVKRAYGAIIEHSLEEDGMAETIDDLIALLEIVPDSHSVRHAAYLHLSLLGRDAEAAEQLRILRDKFPDSLLVLSALRARALADGNANLAKDLEDRMDYIKRYIGLDQALSFVIEFEEPDEED